MDGSTANCVDMLFDACEVLVFDDDTRGMLIGIERGFVEVREKKGRIEGAGFGLRECACGRGRWSVGIRFWSGLVLQALLSERSGGVDVDVCESPVVSTLC